MRNGDDAMMAGTIRDCGALSDSPKETSAVWREDQTCGRTGDIKAHATETSLVTEKRRLEQVCVANRIALWVWDIPTGTVEWSGSVEPGHRIGMFPHTLEAWKSLQHPEDQDRFVKTLNRHLEYKLPCEMDCRMQCSVGGFATWHLTGTSERDEQGRPLRVFGTCVDTTVRKKAEAARRRVEENYLSLFENMLNGFAY